MTSALRPLHTRLRDDRRPEKRLLTMWLAGLLTIGLLGAVGGRVGPRPDEQPHVSMVSSALTGSHGTLRPIGDSAAPGSRAPGAGADLGAGPSHVTPLSDLPASRPGPAPTTPTSPTTSGPGHPRQERAPPWCANVI